MSRLTGLAKGGLKKHRAAIRRREELCDELDERPADVALGLVALGAPDR